MCLSLEMGAAWMERDFAQEEGGEQVHAGPVKISA